MFRHSFRYLISGIAAWLFFPLVYGQTLPPDLKLSQFRPVSIYKIPETSVKSARYGAIDLHSHNYPKTEAEVEQWVKTMDSAGIAKTVILSGATGKKFDSVVDRYARYPGRFEVWCGFDYTGYNEPGWSQKAVKELERCYKKGARGVGELGDKGLGLFYSKPTPAWGMHIDDPRMKPLLEACARLHIPISVHVADPMWMYLPMDAANDGLMNAYKWKIDLTKKGILTHAQMIRTLENAVKENPHTTFVACHLANCSYNLKILGLLFDRFPNLYADISARYEETAAIPRYVHDFYTRYQDRLVYGTDMGTDLSMYRFTLRILESADEHFYYDQSYHWPLYGLYLGDQVLKKIYRENALKILHKD